MVSNYEPEVQLEVATPPELELTNGTLHLPPKVKIDARIYQSFNDDKGIGFGDAHSSQHEVIEELNKQIESLIPEVSSDQRQVTTLVLPRVKGNQKSALKRLIITK